MIRYVLAALALAACVPAPVTPPQPPDASDASGIPDTAPGPMTPCEAACAALRAVGCHDGEVANCVAVWAHIDGARILRTASGKPATCVAAASVHTLAEAKAQGARCE